MTIRLPLRQLVSVKGKVLTPNDTPIAGAEVQATATRRGVRPPLQCRTGFDGSFELWEEAGVRLKIRARKGPETSAQMPVELSSSSESTEVVLYIGQRYVIRGRLRGPTGDSVPGGEVCAFTNDRSLTGGKPPGRSFVAIAEQDGRFEVNVPKACQYVLIGGAHGHVNSSPRTIVVSDANRFPEVELRLLRGIEMVGSVGDESGAALAGVTVAAAPTRRAGDPSWLPQRYLYGRSCSAETDENGRFCIKNLYPAPTYSVVVVPDASKPRLTWRKEGVPRGQEVCLRVAMRLLEPAVFEGEVYWRRPGPFENAIVKASYTASDGTRCVLWKGSFVKSVVRFRVPDLRPTGSYWVTVYEHGRRLESVGPIRDLRRAGRVQVIVD